MDMVKSFSAEELKIQKEAGKTPEELEDIAKRMVTRVL